MKTGRAEPPFTLPRPPGAPGPGGGPRRQCGTVKLPRSDPALTRGTERHNRMEYFDPNLQYTVGGVGLTGGEVFANSRTGPKRATGKSGVVCVEDEGSQTSSSKRDQSWSGKPSGVRMSDSTCAVTGVMYGTRIGVQQSGAVGVKRDAMSRR